MTDVKSPFATVYTLNQPANKIVTLVDGMPKKGMAAPMSRATAVTVRVDSLQLFAELLETINEATNCTMSLGYVPGTEPNEGRTEGEPYQTVTRGIMAEAIGVDLKSPEGVDATLGWNEINGASSICRLKANMVPGCWYLLDLDTVEGEPPSLAMLDNISRLEALKEVFPELAKAGFVRVPSTTGRVIFNGKPMEAVGEHLYFQMDDAVDMERFGAVLLQRSMLAGYGFMKPLFSRKSRTEQIGQRPWGINDPTTASCERLVFDGKPVVEGDGLSVAKARIDVIDGQSVDTHKLLDLTTDEVAQYSEMTGQRVVQENRSTTVIGADGEMTTQTVARFLAVDQSRLQMSTVIETELGEITVENYCNSDYGKLRCQTPFRDSTSWNGILNRFKDGTPFVFDNGLRCRYSLPEKQAEQYLAERCAAEFDELKSIIATTAETEMPDPKPLLKAFARMTFSSETEKALAETAAAKSLGLGHKVKSFRSDVAAEKERLRVKAGGASGAADIKSKTAAGKWDVNSPIPVTAYPFSNDGVLLGHEANYAFMIKAYGIEFSYDMIAKKLLWGANGMDTDTDNAELVLFSRIKSLAALNGLPNSNDAIHTFLPAIAEAKQVNKVRDYLKALEWDGTDRILDLAMAIGPHDVAIGHMSLIRWLVQACAAADGAEIGRKLNPSATAVYEYVLVLHGEQGIGKTKGLQRIVPKKLRQYLKESVVLNINSKDSVLQANSSWIAELGELDATFKAADHVAFKAFMSREKDEMRMPYAAKSSKFKRRTVFVGSVNEPEFLKDKTGARRFYPLAVEHGFPEWPDAVVDQLWAQAWSLYATGEQWWPTDVEAGQLGTNAEAFRAKSWAETQLEGTFRWDEVLSHNYGDDSVRHTVSEIWLRLQGRPYDRHTSLTPIQMAEVGHGLRRLWSAHGAYMFKGHLSIETGQGIVRVNATGGRNRGWILPPYIDEYTRMTEALS